MSARICRFDRVLSDVLTSMPCQPAYVNEELSVWPGPMWARSCRDRALSDVLTSMPYQPAYVNEELSVWPGLERRVEYYDLPDGVCEREVVGVTGPWATCWMSWLTSRRMWTRSCRCHWSLSDVLNIMTYQTAYVSEELSVWLILEWRVEYHDLPASVCEWGVVGVTGP